MRKFLIAITLLFVAVINTMAQEHLSFKGIPIEGSMTEFCQKLKTKVSMVSLLLAENIIRAVRTAIFLSCTN